MKQLLIAMCVAFGLSSALAFAQAVEGSTQENANAAAIEVTEGDVKEALVKIAANTERNVATNTQTAANTAAIAEQARMSGNQDFILKMMTIIVPAIGAAISGWLVILLAKTKNDGEKRGQQQLDSLILVARSVNGLKSELVARSELMSFMEGVKHDPTTPETQARIKELEEALRQATHKSEKVANEVVKELANRHDEPNRMGDEVIVIAPDDTKIMAGEEGATKLQDADGEVVVLAPGETKIVKGEES